MGRAQKEALRALQSVCHFREPTDHCAGNVAEAGITAALAVTREGRPGSGV